MSSKKKFTEFNRRLRAAAEEAGLSQAEIARRLGLTPGAVSHWFNGYNPPRHSEMERLAALVGRSPHYLRTGEEDPVRAEAEVAQSLESLRQSLLRGENIEAAFRAQAGVPPDLTAEERDLLERSGPTLRDYLASAGGESWLRLTEEERETVLLMVRQLARLRSAPPDSSPKPS